MVESWTSSVAVFKNMKRWLNLFEVKPPISSFHWNTINLFLIEYLWRWSYMYGFFFNFLHIFILFLDILNQVHNLKTNQDFPNLFQVTLEVDQVEIGTKGRKDLILIIEDKVINNLITMSLQEDLIISQKVMVTIFFLCSSVCLRILYSSVYFRAVDE